MKKHRHNHTKAVVLLIIALLGLYVVSIKSAPIYAASSQRVNIEDLRNQLRALGAQLRNERNPIKRVEISSRIVVLNEQIKVMEAAQRRVQPKS